MKAIYPAAPAALFQPRRPLGKETAAGYAAPFFPRFPYPAENTLAGFGGVGGVDASRPPHTRPRLPRNGGRNPANLPDSRLPHGEWLPWLGASFAGSQVTASNYMKLAANYQRVGNLPDPEKPASIRQALKLLAAPDKGGAHVANNSGSLHEDRKTNRGLFLEGPKGTNQHAQICAPSQDDAARLRAMLSANLHSGDTAQPAAEALNVSRRSVMNAAKVHDRGAPELVAAVDRGEVAVSDAAKIVERPIEEQAAILEKARDMSRNLVAAERRNLLTLSISFLRTGCMFVRALCSELCKPISATRCGFQPSRGRQAGKFGHICPNIRHALRISTIEVTTP